MKIITPSSDHKDQISKLAIQAYCETFAHLYPKADLDDFLETTYSPEILGPELDDPKFIWRLVLDDTDTPIAYLMLGPVSLPHPEADPSTEGELKRIYILKAAQGQGLGRRLMALGLELLEQKYAKARQWLGVFSDNPKAQNLYKSYGFEKVGDYHFMVGTIADDEYIYSRYP